MLDFVTQCRRDLHRIPELDTALPETCAYVKEKLRGLSCTVMEPTVGSVCAYFDAGKAHTLAFRADMDALPMQEETGLPYASVHAGKMHACGHDGHTAMLLGLAHLVEERRETLRHNVLLVFQPAEESSGGAKPLCESGLFAQYHVKAIFGIHLMPKLPFGEIYTRPGPMMAKSSEMTLRVEGRGVHISRWREGADSILAAGEFLHRVYAMEQSLQSELPRLLRFGHIVGGTVRNAVAAETTMEGTLRAFTLADFEHLRQRCETIAKQVAAESGCTLTLTFSEGYPPLTNDVALLEQVEQQIGNEMIRRYQSLNLATEDFAWYQQYLPGVYFFLGIGDTEELHSSRLIFDDAVLLRGVQLYEKLLDLEI